MIEDYIASFVLGLLTPLGAVCVLPLYPAFLAYLSNLGNGKVDKKTYGMFGLLITMGVIGFMFVLGLLFTTILQISLTNVIGIISPIAFGVLGVISLFLIFDFDFGRFFPRVKIPRSNNPRVSALLYGFFFGAIVIPCNPAFISVFFARAFLVTDFFGSMMNFISFGFGLGFPLLLFSLVSISWSQKVIGFLNRNKRVINVVAGLMMLGISIYYLMYVFRVFG
jgi:cytochrome c-type biogenesis protein